MYAQKKSIDNTHIVRERDRQRHRELLAVLSLGLPIGLFLLLFTWQNLEVIRLGHEATRLQKQAKDLEAGNKSLQLQLDRMTGFDSVEQQAAQLGFTATDSKAIVIVAGVLPSVSEGAGRTKLDAAAPGLPARPARSLAPLGTTSAASGSARAGGR